MSDALWSEAELTEALGAPAERAAGARRSTGCRSTPARLARAICSSRSRARRATATTTSRAPSRRGRAPASSTRARAGELAALGPVFVVDDTLRAMERLGVAARARTRARIVAVTGSVGKTSAKEMLRVALAKAGPTHASAASYNNHWGVPLTLARMPAAAAFGVFEIGMNHAGEIAPLVADGSPSRRAGDDHRAGAYRASRFAGGDRRGQGGNLRRRRARRNDRPQSRRAPVCTAGSARRADAGARCGPSAPTPGRTRGCCSFDPEAARVEASVDGRPIAFTLGAPGLHMAQNALGVLLAVEALGADLAASCRGARGILRAERAAAHA